MHIEKQRLPWFSLLFFALIGAGFWFGRSATEKPDPLQPAQIAKKMQAIEKYRFAQAPPSPPPRPDTEPAPAQPNSDGVTDPSALPSAEAQTLLETCRTDWTTVADMDITGLEGRLIRWQKILSEDCAEKMLHEVDASPIKRFLRECHFNLVERSADEIQSVCLPQLDFFRAYVVSQVQPGTQNPQEQSESALRDSLVGRQMDLSSLSKEEIDKNIETASALISKDPDSYLGYKSLLVNLLINEVKFGEDVDAEIYGQLYDELMTFEGVTAEDEILAEAGNDLQEGEGGAEEEAALPEATELVGIDQDLVHIPFLRLSALNDIGGLQASAEEYIEEFPDSYVGYFYLGEALWKQGDEVGAFRAVKEGLKKDTNDEMVLRLFSEFQSSPLDRIYRISPR